MSVRTGREAAAWFRSQVGQHEFHLMCKAFVRTGFNVEPSRSGTAIECLREAQHVHHEHDPEKVPGFVPAFMDTSNAAEHVLATVGRDHAGHRLAVSTDAAGSGIIGLVRLADIVHSWGPLLGWTEDFDGQRVWTPRPIVQLANIVDSALHEGDETGDPPLHAHAVGLVEQALVAERLLSPKWVNGRFGPRKRQAYRAWQSRAGFTMTGIPTMGDLSRLALRHGFDVR